MRICNLTSVHTRGDIRIFEKVCRSLAAAGHEVNFVVADGLGDSCIHGVRVWDAGRTPGRWQRIATAPGRVMDKGLQTGAGVFHLHDPELIPIGLKLKRLGKTVIFDAHEDFPAQLRTKSYLHPLAGRLLSTTAEFYEAYAFKRFDALIAATPKIAEKLRKLNPVTENINNFPILDELSILEGERKEPTSGKGHVSEISYVGGIEEIRGIKQLIRAMALVKKNVRLNLVGKFTRQELSEEVRSYPGWSKVNELGFLNRKEVAECLSRSMAGVVTFLPAPNHINSQPNKMFEYMSAGLPVIASDFPLWQEIIVGNKCGVCVDPNNPAAVAEAIDALAADPEHARAMGERGRLAVQTKYNWTAEEKKLLFLYESLAGTSVAALDVA